MFRAKMKEFQFGYAQFIGERGESAYDGRKFSAIQDRKRERERKFFHFFQPLTLPSNKEESEETERRKFVKLIGEGKASLCTLFLFNPFKAKMLQRYHEK